MTRTGPTPGCAVCVDDGWEDCRQHEACEGDFCGGDDNGEASYCRLSELTGEEGSGVLDLGPICRAEYKRRAEAFATWEAAGDYARDQAKDAGARR